MNYNIFEQGFEFDDEVLSQSSTSPNTKKYKINTSEISLTSWWAEDRYEIRCATPANNRSMVTHCKSCPSAVYTCKHLQNMSHNHKVFWTRGPLKRLDSVSMQLKILMVRYVSGHTHVQCTNRNVSLFAPLIYRQPAYTPPPLLISE
jgi:hypothetical protein